MEKKKGFDKDSWHCFRCKYYFACKKIYEGG